MSFILLIVFILMVFLAFCFGISVALQIPEEQKVAPVSKIRKKVENDRIINQAIQNTIKGEKEREERGEKEPIPIEEKSRKIPKSQPKEITSQPKHPFPPIDITLKGKREEEDGKEEGEEGKEKEDTTRYSDPVGGACYDTMGTCREGGDCFISYGYLSYPDCMEKAENIQNNINKFNIKHLEDGKKRKKDVKYVSWRPPSDTVKEPQCLVMDDTAIIKTEEKGWKTLVRNPKHFTMTNNPSIYMVEDTCPVFRGN